MFPRLASIIAINMLCLSNCCFGLVGLPFDKVDGPWFTGPILTPNAWVATKGHYNIEPYYFWTETYARYDKNWKRHSIPAFYQSNPLLFYRIGLTEKMGFGGIIQYFHNHTQGKSSTVFGDLPLTLDYQVYAGKKEENSLAVKASIQETFPTGRYDRLSPNKFGTDIGGTGAYVTQLSLTTSMVFYFGNQHFLRVRGFAGVNLPSHVRVKGINAYGGDRFTKGTVHPGTSFIFLSSMEFSFNQNWVYAMDLAGVFGDKTTFRGRSTSPVGGPSFAQWSVTPSLEYNFNEHVGVIAGAWLTIAGRNAGAFDGGSVAMNIYY